MEGQRTSTVSEGLARQMVRMDEDFVRQYPGGTARLELAKGHPDIKARTFALWDALAAEQKRRLPLLERGPRFTVELGRFAEPAELIAALDTAGVKYYDAKYMKEVLRRINLSQQKEMAEGYRVTPGDVGNVDRVRLDTFYTQSETVGFGDVVPEFAALVALQYAQKLQRGDNPGLEIGEWYVAGSQPIVDADGSLCLLGVRRSGDGVYLYWSYGHPGGEWSPDYRFLRSRK